MAQWSQSKFLLWMKNLSSHCLHNILNTFGHRTRILKLKVSNDAIGALVDKDKLHGLTSLASDGDNFLLQIVEAIFCGNDVGEVHVRADGLVRMTKIGCRSSVWMNRCGHKPKSTQRF